MNNGGARRRRLVVFVFGITGIAILFMAISWRSSEAALVTRTWDGGGATNNWSEPANWSGDIVPTENDDVVFDGTSTKNAFIDTSSSVRSLNIAAGYSGTISQSGSAVFGIITGASSMAGGTFICGGTVNFNGITFNLSAGSFNCSNGTFNSSNSFNLIISGGTFTAPNGTMTLGSGSSIIETGASGAFVSNGTIVATGDFATFRIINGTAATLDVNNLTIDLANPGGSVGANEPADRLRILGTLTLARGDTQGTLEALGPVTILDTWGTGNQSGKLTLAGSATRTVTLPTLAPAMSYVHIELNAPNTTVNTSGPGPVRLKSISLGAGIMNTGTIPFSLGTGDSFRTSTVGGGAFNCGGLVTLNAVELVQVGGVFNCVNGTIDSNFVVIRINGGTFEAPTGTMRLSSPTGSVLEFGASGTFDSNDGTMIFAGGSAQIVTSAAPASVQLGNLTLDLANSFLMPTGLTLGIKDLSQVRGEILQGTLNVSGNVSIGSAVTANGNNASIAFVGSSPQTYTNNGGTNFQGDWTINKPGGSLTLQSSLGLAGGFGVFNLTNGSITTGAHVVDLGTRNVTRTNGHVIGNLKRRFAVTGIKTFDVGTANGYAPVSVNVTSLGTNPSDLTVGNTQGTHPVLPPNISLGRYWSITESGNVTANLTFNYLQSDVNGNENNYKVNRIVGNQVEVIEPPTATVDTAANTAIVSGVTDFSDWTLSGAGPPLALSPLNPTIGSGFSIPFNATGGVPPYTFSIPTNNSGASINTATGFYVAGGTFGVQDTVQVTDSNNESVTTNVTVIDPFLVVNTNDSGVGSLRQAMINANGTAGSQTIRFNIPGTPPFTIAPATPLPIITGSTFIDGRSQPGYAGAPIIELNGTNANGNGLEFQDVSSSMIFGLAINRFAGNGILVNSSQQVTVHGSYIGVGLDGITPRGNGTHGVSIVNSNACFLGGVTPATANVISANGFDGVVIAGSVQTNLHGNFIGAGADGTSPAGNARTGVRIIGGNANAIGGVGPETANVIAFTGTVNPPVTPRGGVVVEGEGGPHLVRRNSIHSNVGLGIDLNTSVGGGDGVTPNDNCDTDTGPNGLQNYPFITSASSTSGGTIIHGDFNSTPSTSFRIDFYASSEADPSGNGEGRTFIGSTILQTSAGCGSSFTVALPDIPLPAGTFITATASGTPLGEGTSEFSPARAVEVECNYGINPTSQNFNANGGNGTFSVNTDPGCSWSAFASAPFISVVSNPQGSGPGTVNFIVAPNTTGSPRSGSITAGGQTFTITQAAECVYSINPTAQNFGQAGGTGTIDVQTNPGCAWTAVSGASYITITGGGSGNGAGTVNYSVLSSSGPRSGTITVAGKTFTVAQLAIASSCATTGGFRITSLQISPSSLSAAFATDVNRDGIPDLVYTQSFAPPHVAIAFGKGDGTFSSPTVTEIVNADNLNGFRNADFDNDGRLDLLLKVRNAATQQQELRLGLGNGGGGFSVSQTLPAFDVAGGDFVAGDFNGDGKQDIVAQATITEQRVFFGNGDGTFAEPLLRPGPRGLALVTADINRDGKLDIVTASGNQADVRLGNGDGSFSTSASLTATGLFGNPELADFNRDGKFDIAIPDVVGISPNSVSTARVFLGNGTGGFAPGIPLSPVNGFVGISSNDFNRDGIRDLVVAGGLGDTLAVFRGLGDGRFALLNTYSMFTAGIPVVGDFNLDGKPDIAVGGAAGNTSILLNSCGGLTQKPKIDFDGDGKSDIAIFRPSTGEWYVLRSSDGSYFSFQFGLGSDLAAAADFDGDNKTDAAVFRPLTGEWFVLRSSDAGTTITVFGTNGDRPAPGDYDGDGKTDFAVFRPSTGQWWVMRSSDNQAIVFQWGVGSDVIIQ